MLTPNELLHISEGAEEIAEALHQDILNRIIDRIMIRLGRGDDYILTAIDKWQIQLLQDAGYLLEDIQQEIARRTPYLRQEIAEAMEDAGVRAISYDDRIYEAAGLHPSPIEESPALIRIMQRNYEATLGEMTNFTGTLAQAAQQAYIQACDKAYNQVLSGSIGYTQAVREAVEELVSDGVTVTYPSGHTDTIETATLRAVRTGVSQASGQIQTARMDEMGVDLVLVSSHMGARPEHALWQGNVYSRSGASGKYPDFVSSTGYGTVTGLCGANCRHSFGPYFEGMENPFEQYDSEENRKAYEQQQRQRTLERRIRKTKREVMGLNQARNQKGGEAMEADYQRKAALLQKQNAAYNQFCEENGLKKLPDRISIAKWDRSQAAQARAAARRHRKALENQADYDKMVEDIRSVGHFAKNASVHIPPQEVFARGLSFDDAHINKQRNHHVSREMAEIWIRDSKLSVTVWNGRYERYYGENGAVYVDWLENKIRTAYSGLEFDDTTKAILEVVKKHGH